ncbi:DUF2690 domain-containing protein [Kitasatospora sp. NPDC058063]|uniref:DUF2690 domain-containing protein n=1 Tax=unclassified Kitasatospora TaxID=2633591 RepID=UPI0036D975AC
MSLVKIRTAMVAFASSAALIGGTAVLAAPTASAATPQVTAGCYGSSCTHKDPMDMGCSPDAYTVESVASTLGTIELRYSPSCKANWARVYGASDARHFWVQNSHGEAAYWMTFGATGYSDMVDGAVEARACFSDGETCTGWH